MPTEIWSLQLRSGRKDGRKEGWKEGGKEEEAILIKSRDPHLVGKNTLNAHLAPKAHADFA